MTKIKIQSLFPVELTLFTNGKVILRDIQGNAYEVRNKDNTALTLKQFNEIVENEWGYWSIAGRFLLIIVVVEDK